jgi:general secretion pathway protein G
MKRARLDNRPQLKHIIPVMHCFPNPSRPRAARRNRGFTLLEILVALAILGLLVGLAVTKTGGIFDSSQITVAKLFVQTGVKTGLTSYKMATGNYPTTTEGIQALITPPAGKEGRWNGPYIEGSKVPIDPWGNPYQYAYPGTHNKDGFDIWSKGPDGQEGTGDDIGNWDKPAETK